MSSAMTSPVDPVLLIRYASSYFRHLGCEKVHARQFLPFQSTAGHSDAESSHGNAVFIILKLRRKKQSCYGNPL